MKFIDQTYVGASFLVEAPITLPKKLKPHIFTQLCDEEAASLIITRYTTKPFPAELHAMERNFQRERGDLVSEKPYDEVYLFHKHLARQNKWLDTWNCVGGVAVVDKNIGWMWLHPYLRGYGVGSFFLIMYATQIRYINIMPPLSKAMQCALSQASAHICNHEDLHAPFRQLATQHLFEDFGADCLWLQSLDMAKFWRLLADLSEITNNVEFDFDVKLAKGKDLIQKRMKEGA